MLGFECATVPAQRVINPERNIPRATLLGTLFAGLVYVAASGAVLFLLLPASVAAKSAAPFADSSRLYWGPGAGTAVVFFAAIASRRTQRLGALVGDIPHALAERGVFPRGSAEANGRGMPVRAQLLGTVTVFGAYRGQLYARADRIVQASSPCLATVATLVLYCVAAIAALRLASMRLRPRGCSSDSCLARSRFLTARGWKRPWGAVLLATGVPV